MKVFLIFLSVALTVLSSPISKDDLRLIKTSEKDPGVWMSQSQIDELVSSHANFIDVTDYDWSKVGPGRRVNANAIPTVPIHQSAVRPLLSQIDEAGMTNFVTSFSAYHTRYYQSATGLESQKWLLTQVQQAIQGYQGSASVSEFPHSWTQSSVIAKIEGSDPTLKSEVVIIGAHLDSINRFGTNQVAPGADDNGSGCVLVLETLRVLIAANFIPKRTLEFHWYAAEEVGLRGSADIARTYANTNVNVVAVSNFDVMGYFSGLEKLGIYTDYTTAAVNVFLRSLVDEYCSWGWVDGRCGYGCSDHASWFEYGFPAGFPSEETDHPQMHTGQDTVANMLFTQVVEFTKLSIAFMVEMGEPSN